MSTPLSASVSVLSFYPEKSVLSKLEQKHIQIAYKNGVCPYCGFPSEHWTRIRTNNVIERLNREIRRRTRVVFSPTRQVAGGKGSSFVSEIKEQSIRDGLTAD